ncbi:DUF58 domain-containing protein [Rhabdothermincola sp.]|uniref:DUF58 domain-containing protein n=1 Tax=Rhabdothermincola sp. TaxID=2820405 RepID=UPI002FE1951A
MSSNRELRGVLNRPPSLATSPSAEVLRRLELTITRRLDGILQGDYRGLVPGHGSDLGETREYQPGDDVRRMDWNVTARLRTPHIRQTIADRELETWVLTDLTASLGFGTAECEKRDLAVAAVAAVGFLTARGGNRVGAVTMEAGHLATIPARSGRVNLQALLHRVIEAAREERAGTADLEAAIRRVGATMRRRGLAVIVSDFLDRSPWERPLRALAAHHEVLAVEVVDPRELELPDIGVVRLVDPESGAQLEVQTANAKLRQRYAARAAEQRAEIARRIRAAGADHLVLRTDRDWLVDLVQFVARRRERIDALTRVRP